MEVKPIIVYVWARTLDGVLSVFGLSELNAIFDKALQTVFEKPLNEIMNEPMDYSNAWRVKFQPSLSNYLIWSKLSKEEIPYVMEAFNSVLSHMLDDYLFSLMEPIYKD